MSRSLPQPSCSLVESPSLASAPDCIDARYDREQVRVAIGLSDRYEPLVLNGRYVLLHRIARGASGSVYLAEDARLRRRVAIKVINARIAADAQQQARLLDEARALAFVRHDNVLVVHDVGETEAGERFLAMDHVDGSTLRRWQQGQPIGALLSAYRKAGRGLAAAHRVGIVHRDFKPDNVFVSPTTCGPLRVVVGDFGLAESVHGDLAMPAGDGLSSTCGLGTPQYMAPEQDAGQCSPWVDQYAFCVSLWEAITGARPLVEARGVSESSLPRPPCMPRRIYEALLRGLERRPERRHADMETLLAMLGEPRSPRASSVVALAALLAVSMPLLVRERDVTEVSQVDVHEASPALWPISNIPLAAEARAPASPPRSTKPSRTGLALRAADLRSILLSVDHPCRGWLELRLDRHERIVAPDVPILHGRRASTTSGKRTLRVKCPDDAY